MQAFSVFCFIVVLFVVIIIANAVRILREYERGVIFRLGRLIGVKGPGLILLIPIVDKMVKVSLRTVVMDVPPQDVITKDNVSIKVNAVVYFRVVQPDKAIVEVENYPLRHVAALADDPPQHSGPVGAGRTARRSATRSTASCRRSSTTRPSPGGSRSRTWR